MKQEENSFGRELCLEEMHEMEETIPMTLSERNRVRKWVYSGHTVRENPWRYKDSDGYELNYLDAYHHHLEEIWGEFYRPFYRVIPTCRVVQETYEGGYLDEEPFY